MLINFFIHAVFSVRFPAIAKIIPGSSGIVAATEECKLKPDIFAD